MSDHHPYRLATYNFELTLPSAPDGPTDQPVKFNFARQVNVVSSEESLADEAKLEFKRWCDKHLKVSVETKLIGTMEDVAEHYETQVKEVVEDVATILYLSDSSDYQNALRDVLRRLAPHKLTDLDEGWFRPKEID